MRFGVRFCVVSAIVLTLTGLIAAQTTTGTITGRVLDLQHFPMPGVTVHVESPNLQGRLSVVTSANGDYIVGLLPPGTYTLSFELDGFQPQRHMVVVAPTQTVPLDIALGPAPLSESVEVAGRLADVLTRTAQVATDFDAELIATWPTNRDLNAYLLRAPSVHPTGPSGAYSFSGAMSFESVYFVNGVTVNENLRGQANPLYIEDAIQETIVATDGVSAEYGRFSGGLVNIVTKSGGNLFSGSFRDTLVNDNWRAYVTGNDAFLFTADCDSCASGAPTKVDRVVPQYEYVLGGPARKDRLWFFTAGRFVTQQFSRSTAAPLNIPYVAENDRKRFELKATGSISPRHRLEAAYTKESLDQVNNAFQQGVPIMDLASLYNNSAPQDLFALGYNGVLGPTLFVESRFSVRHSANIGSGSTSTDLVKGTLLQDRQRSNQRYWSPTFCGVCDPEDRDNDNEYVKATYFKSTSTRGTHNVVFGYDTFNDKRFANNHQSGSDFRILGTTSIVRDSGAGAVIYPQFLPESTIVQANPIASGTLGTKFRSHALFVNDHVRWNSRLTVNLGVRWDRNHGVDGAGSLVADDSAISPRVGVVWDPLGTGSWSVNASWAKYTAALNNSVADSQSAAGNPATFQWAYQGPAVNADPAAATLLTPADAIPIVFKWFNDNGGLNLPNPSVALVPGFSIKIPGGLSSPNVRAYAVGLSRQFARGALRADYSFRDYGDFYSQRIDGTTGTVTDPRAGTADLAVIENTNGVKRRYSGLTMSATYRVDGRTDVGGNYTLSRLWGNFDGETATGGPATTDLFSYPEFRQQAWYAPEGDLSADQRHRATFWINYGVPGANGLMLSLLQDLASGLPFGAVGTVDARPYVTNPGYAQPQGATSEIYYYTARDAFRTEPSRKTDFAANYTHRVRAASRTFEAFVQAHVLNLFNTQDMCGCGADVFTSSGAVYLSRVGTGVITAVNTPALAAFDPFTTTPVRGVNWDYHPNFGKPVNRFAFTSPRAFRLSFGIRF